MAHLTEEELARYAFDPEAMLNRKEIEAHVAECPQCSASLTFIRSVDTGLADPEAWEIGEQDDSATREAMRELAAQVAEEDEEAEALLAEMLESPARIVFANLATRRKYRTAGVVRRLLRAAHDACDRDPLDALTFADTAIEIAEQLAEYPETIIGDLRGTAWKERANALGLLGRYDPALEALDHAERAFQKVPSAPLGLTIVQHARAVIYYERGELTAAKELFVASAEAYVALGEVDRYMRARHATANVLFGQGDLNGAKAIYEAVLAWSEGQNDLTWIGRENNTLGRCAYELGDFSAAVQHFHRSIKAFREQGSISEVTRPEWGLALVVLGSGKPSEALSRFRGLREEFHRSEMIIDEALVSLDMMDALYALGKMGDIVKVATEITQTFVDAGMLTSALTAFAYLKEAAKSGGLSPQTIEHVRSFIGRLEREPKLLFLAPRENPS